MLREHQFLHDLATATRIRDRFRDRFSQSGSLINPPEPLQRNAVWGIKPKGAPTIGGPGPYHWGSENPRLCFENPRFLTPGGFQMVKMT